MTAFAEAGADCILGRHLHRTAADSRLEHRTGVSLILDARISGYVSTHGSSAIDRQSYFGGQSSFRSDRQDPRVRARSQGAPDYGCLDGGIDSQTAPRLSLQGDTLVAGSAVICKIGGHCGHQCATARGCQCDALCGVVAATTPCASGSTDRGRYSANIVLNPACERGVRRQRVQT